VPLILCSPIVRALAVLTVAIACVPGRAGAQPDEARTAQMIRDLGLREAAEPLRASPNRKSVV
jgi:hypothetical protein